MVFASMSGQIVIADLAGNIIAKRRDHAKYVVSVKISDNVDRPLLATAAWDNKINVYSLPTSGPPTLVDPIATINLPSKPESILFLQHPESQQPVLLISRTDSTHLYYYTTETEPRLLGHQNLAPHSNAWVAFTPSALAICPTDPSLLACATSAVPSMKLLIARMLIPPWDVETAAALLCSTTTLMPPKPRLRRLDWHLHWRTKKTLPSKSTALRYRLRAHTRHRPLLGDPMAVVCGSTATMAAFVEFKQRRAKLLPH
jgi:hypothetical protein